MEQIILTTFLMLILWFSIIVTNKIIYPIKNSNKLEQYRINTNIPLIHSISISILSCFGCFYNNINYYHIISGSSLSYFIIDIFTVIYNREYLYIFHHLIAIIAICYVNLFETHHLLLLNYCLMTEISTPFLYRWKLSKIIYPNYEYKYFIEFAIIFIIIRPLFLMFNLFNHYHILTYSYSLLLYLSLLTLNIGWSIGIIHLGINYKITT